MCALKQEQCIINWNLCIYKKYVTPFISQNIFSGNKLYHNITMPKDYLNVNKIKEMKFRNHIKVKRAE